jgi:hypothetical protein
MFRPFHYRASPPWLPHPRVRCTDETVLFCLASGPVPRLGGASKASTRWHACEASQLLFAIAQWRLKHSPERHRADQNAVRRLPPQKRCGDPPRLGRNKQPHHWQKFETPLVTTGIFINSRCPQALLLFSIKWAILTICSIRGILERQAAKNEPQSLIRLSGSRRPQSRARTRSRNGCEG